MRIGSPKEIKIHEYRVGLTPASVSELIENGHEVVIETGAGVAAGFDDSSYAEAGATICANADELYSSSELIIKVKEPQLEECKKLQAGQVIFTYLHLAADPKQAEALLESNVTAISYETVTADDGSLPLLTPMSRIAGRLSALVASHYLAHPFGRAGLLPGGVPGVPPAKFTVIGAGIAGTSAIEIAIGLGADVTALDKDIRKLEALDARFGNALSTVYATRSTIEAAVLAADVLIGAVLMPGAAAPEIVDRSVIERMTAGSVVIDISIDQGGCFPTSRPTTHSDPIYLVGDVIHYCVTNMPGSVPKTATLALNNATLPYALQIANEGWESAIASNRHLANGLTVHAGQICHDIVAAELGFRTRSQANSRENAAADMLTRSGT